MTLTKKEIAEEIRELQAASGERVLAISTLVKKSREALEAMWEELDAKVALTVNGEDIKGTVAADIDDGEIDFDVDLDIDTRGLWARFVAWLKKLF